MTKYAVIAAIDWQGGFAKHGKIPWYFKEDFQHFRKLTTGQICVMGKHTYEDINERLGEKAIPNVLPNRTSVVLSSTIKSLPNAIVFKSCEDLIDCVDQEERTVFFIGGERVFEEGLKIADEVYLTIIPNDYECDTFFPVDTIVANFTIESETESDSGLTFIKAVRTRANDINRDKDPEGNIRGSEI